ncbi:hypothetical protein FA13DRAFT_1776003 [Coprinellus micaceus]|uniref:Uncharacterized protein n=1 Tax=Coprinellus micaceus TaxID=71717 RepID=A0A4Y7T2Y0_COPMI|nr:hypothetical protein FA13DRAFT_1776003 [Coprinellus micaceus]
MDLHLKEGSFGPIGEAFLAEGRHQSVMPTGQLWALFGAFGGCSEILTRGLGPWYVRPWCFNWTNFAFGGGVGIQEDGQVLRVLGLLSFKPTSSQSSHRGEIPPMFRKKSLRIHIPEGSKAFIHTAVSAPSINAHATRILDEGEYASRISTSKPGIPPVRTTYARVIGLHARDGKVAEAPTWICEPGLSLPRCSMRCDPGPGRREKKGVLFILRSLGCIALPSSSNDLHPSRRRRTVPVRWERGQVDGDWTVVNFANKARTWAYSHPGVTDGRWPYADGRGSGGDIIEALVFSWKDLSLELDPRACRRDGKEAEYVLYLGVGRGSGTESTL